MKVAHMLLQGASRYDRACAEIDAADGSGVVHRLLELETIARRSTSFDQLLRADGTAILHIHGSTQPSRRILAGLTVPWVSDRLLPLPRVFFRRIPPPAAILLDRVPEAAGGAWFAEVRSNRHSGPKRVGTYVRGRESRNNVEQVVARIQRFRDDVVWTSYEEPPTPRELASLDLWVDPAVGDDDLDGMVPEAIACLTPVVASRTAPNKRRLDDGKAGVLVPVSDHNELTHAVLNVLFKAEVADPLAAHAKRIRDRFRPQHRQLAVRAVYEELGQ